MSGSGRKSQYRKSVTSDYLDDSRTLKSNETFAEVLGNRGAGIFEIVLCRNGGVGLGRLPKRFNKLIWIKRGDFIIVESDETSTPAADNEKSKVQYTINHILSKPNIKFLKANGEWPIDLGTVCSSDDKQKIGVGYDNVMPDYVSDDELREEDNEHEK